MNKLTIQGDWNIAKGKLKQKYGQLTDHDLTYLDGKEDEMWGRLQKKTGATREALERYLADDSASLTFATGVVGLHK
jgi:uncharacterized protein YjbJ (UPF0337 family)